jgi:uncharacterized FAD-dependent dehydrogenase
LAIRITDIRVALDFPEDGLFSRVLSIIGVPREEVERFSVIRRGLDARRKGEVRRVFAVECSLRSAGLEEAVCSRVANARPVDPRPDPLLRTDPLRIGRFSAPWNMGSEARRRI